MKQKLPSISKLMVMFGLDCRRAVNTMLGLQHYLRDMMLLKSQQHSSKNYFHLENIIHVLMIGLRKAELRGGIIFIKIYWWQEEFI